MIVSWLYMTEFSRGIHHTQEKVHILKIFRVFLKEALKTRISCHLKTVTVRKGKQLREKI